MSNSKSVIAVIRAAVITVAIHPEWHIDEMELIDSYLKSHDICNFTHNLGIRESIETLGYKTVKDVYDILDILDHPIEIAYNDNEDSDDDVCPSFEREFSNSLKCNVTNFHLLEEKHGSQFAHYCGNANWTIYTFDEMITHTEFEAWCEAQNIVHSKKSTCPFGSFITYMYGSDVKLRHYSEKSKTGLSNTWAVVKVSPFTD